MCIHPISLVLNHARVRNRGTPTDLIEWLEAEGHGPVVDHAGWKRIDEEEQARARPEAPREKLVVPEELLSTAAR